MKKYFPLLLLSFLFFTPHAHAASFSLVNDTYFSTQTSGNYDDHSYVIPTVAAGNMLVAMLAAPGSVTSMSGGGMTWVFAAKDSKSDMEIWYGLNSTGVTTPTITYINGGGGTEIAQFQEYSWSGGNTASVLLNTVASSSRQGATATVSTTPTAALNAVMVVGVNDNYGGTYISGPTGGFSNASGTPQPSTGVAYGYQIVANTAGTYTYTITFNDAYASPASVMAVFTMTGGGGSSVIPVVRIALNFVKLILNGAEMIIR